MKYFHIAFFSLLMVFSISSCDMFAPEGIPITDNGFEVKPEVEWNPEYMAYMLNIYLTKGETGKFTMKYSIDSDASIDMLDMSGKAVDHSTTLTLKSNTALSYILPSLPSSSSHVLNLNFDKNGITRNYTINLPNTSQKAIGVSIDASDDENFSTVTLHSNMANNNTDYTVFFYLDGAELEGIKYMGNDIGSGMIINIPKGQDIVFELPYIVPGNHLLLVEIKSNSSMESTSLTFTEPQRRRTSIELSYNKYTNRLEITSNYNPNETEFDISIGISVHGELTYRHEQFFGIADAQTNFYTEIAEASTTVTPGLTAIDIDGGALKKAMDNIYNHTATDAANSIGNGNARILHTDITVSDLKFTIHSCGDFAGNTPVNITPGDSYDFPVTYYYTSRTWSHGAGTSDIIKPSFTINGKPSYKVNVL